MRRLIFPLALCLSLIIPGAAQSQEADKDSNQNQPPPRSERSREAGESSSRDTRIDLSPPKDDAKDHPNSTLPAEDTDENASGGVAGISSLRSPPGGEGHRGRRLLFQEEELWRGARPLPRSPVLQAQ